MNNEFNITSVDLSNQDLPLWGNYRESAQRRELSILSRYTFHVANLHFTGILYLKENFLDSYTEGFYLPERSGIFIIDKNNNIFSVKHSNCQVFLLLNYLTRSLQWQYCEKIKEDQWRCHDWNTIVSFQ